MPVPYFHIVFTLRYEFSALVLQNKRLLYDLLFRTSAASLLELARDPKRLRADTGFLNVLHTWGQNLQFHPHIHYIVPADGLVLDGSRWVDSSRKFFLPVKALSRVFAGKSYRNCPGPKNRAPPRLVYWGSPDRNLTFFRSNPDDRA